MTYTVYFKDSRSLFWRKIRNVESEGFVRTTDGIVMPAKFFLRADKVMIEVPTSCLIKYSKGRYLKMVKRLEELKKKKTKLTTVKKR